ncbi:MAG: sialidase family protein [Planctomycetia bacterium]|nr:sialidase family protein [Planctomycetia bacterium]
MTPPAHSPKSPGSTTWTRRDLLKRSACLGFLPLFAPLSAAEGDKSSKIDGRILENVLIRANSPQGYQGWPTVAKLPNGDLAVVVSAGREGHVCPFGRVDFFRSSDGGKTWSEGKTILNHPADDRDAGICVTSKGTILVTTFTSFAYLPALEQERKRRAQGKGTWSDERFQRWEEAHRPFETLEKRKEELGCWMIRSEDGGKTWSERYRSLVNSPHGPIQLRDGRLLYPGIKLWENPRTVGIAHSLDDGKTWSWLADLQPVDGENINQYHELHGVETESGRLVVHVRSHAPSSNGETLQTESDDGGKTWTRIHRIGVWGLPSHLLKLSDGRLLMTYGHRRDPFGNLARISTNEGRSWSEEFRLNHCPPCDLGYPSTIQRDDGTLVSVWYEAGSVKAAIWQLN